MQIDHINIKAPEKLLTLEKDFLIQVLQLTLGNRPNSTSVGYWLCHEDKAIIHLSVDESRESVQHQYFDHIAFSSTNVVQFVQHLGGLSVAYKHQYMSEIQLTQIFFTTPLGVKIEVNFPGERIT